jgi:hypothetical protein
MNYYMLNLKGSPFYCSGESAEEASSQLYGFLSQYYRTSLACYFHSLQTKGERYSITDYYHMISNHDLSSLIAPSLVKVIK